MGYDDRVEIGEMVGKTFTTINKNMVDQELYFEEGDGHGFKMFHDQDCCEGVYLEDVVGELGDLVGSPILKAEENTSDLNPKDNHDDDFKWTFYNISTAKGTVTLRWYGESNGYYSIGVDLERY